VSVDQLQIPLARKPRRRAPIALRMQKFIQRGLTPDDCWMWTGAQDRHGYGQISRGGRGEGHISAHRAVYEALVGPIPEGFDLDHLCRVPLCVNPTHLEPVTRGENTRRGLLFATLEDKANKRTHCKRGHEFTEANTYRRPKGSCKICRLCERDRSRAKRAET
jgi:HNH endonuclease